MNPSQIVQRWRVRGGYLLAVVVLLLARPGPRSILLGAVIGAVGLFIRAYAAGFLHKQEILTTTGPYAYTRNPLYFGSSFLALGAAIAMRSIIGGMLLLAYFSLVYTFVMRREEQELRRKHLTGFDAYAISVPLFFPAFSRKEPTESERGAFSWGQYKRNHEYEAAFGFVLLLIALAVIWKLRAA